MQRRGSGLGAVMFTDIVGSTAIAAEMGNTRWSELVARHHRIVRRAITRFGGREVDTAGDGFFATFERPADAIRCAVAAADAVRELGVEIRAGIGFGELEAVGRKPAGLVVNTAARVMGVAGPGEILVPSSVREIVSGGGISFADHGFHSLKGFAEDYRLFTVRSVDGREVQPPLAELEAAERRRGIFPIGARRGALLLGVGVGVVALIAAALLVLGGNDPATSTGPPGPLRHAVAEIDPETGAIRSSVFVGDAGLSTTGLGYPDQPIAVGQGGVWLLQPPSLLHVDPQHLDVRDRILLGHAASHAVVVGFDAIWALGDRTLYRVNPATDDRNTFLTIPETGITTLSVALADAVWVGVSNGDLIRMDPRTEARDQVDVGVSIDAIAATGDAVWLGDAVAETVLPIDPVSMRRIGRPLNVGTSLDQLHASGEDLWVLDRGVGLVTRINTATGSKDSARVGDDPTDMAVGPDAVWVGDRDGSLRRIDALTSDVEAFDLGAEVLGVAIDADEGTPWVWLGAAIGAN
jgi:class 3 adenylate cyclase/streptogramin lyase